MMRELFDLNGKVALVTGATHGLGMAMAKALAKSGATLVIAGNTPEKMDRAIKEYADAKIVAYGYLFDVSDEVAVDNQISAIEKDIGPINILINNAGMIQRVPALEINAEDFRRVIDIDL